MNADGTFEAGSKVHLTIAATVNAAGIYTINDDRGNLWGHCPPGMSFLVKVEAAPVELPTWFGAVIRATVRSYRSGSPVLLILMDPARDLWAELDRDGMIVASELISGKALTVVEVLFEGVEP